jgi:hypothetical protein
VRRGGDIAPLLVGKFAVEHIPIITELQYRKVLQPAAILPRFLTDSAAQQRLKELRSRNVTVLTLLEGAESNETSDAG